MGIWDSHCAPDTVEDAHDDVNCDECGGYLSMVRTWPPNPEHCQCGDDCPECGEYADDCTCEDGLIEDDCPDCRRRNSDCICDAIVDRGRDETWEQDTWEDDRG